MLHKPTTPQLHKPPASQILIIATLLSLLVLQFFGPRITRPLHLPEQQQPRTSNPKIGLHTRLTGYNDEVVIERSFRQLREMGASWAVDLFPWAYIQPRSRYGYDWTGADMVVAHARRQGLTLVARMDIVPAWARPSDSNDRFLAPEHYVDYADYVTAFLVRYRPYGVRHVIIWNEPNLTFEWGRRPPDPQAYAALLKVVYPRVKAAVPEAVIIAGALSPGPSLGDGRERLDDLAYTRALYQAGAAAYFDIWGVHAYGARTAPRSPPQTEQVNFRRVELVQRLLTELGDPQRRIMITEGGWNDNPRWTGAVRPADRLRWTVEAYRMAQEWPWLEAMCLWQFSTPWQSHTYQDNWNFVATDGTPKAIYYAVRDAFVAEH